MRPQTLILALAATAIAHPTIIQRFPQDEPAAPESPFGKLAGGGDSPLAGLMSGDGEAPNIDIGKIISTVIKVFGKIKEIKAKMESGSSMGGMSGGDSPGLGGLLGGAAGGAGGASGGMSGLLGKLGGG